VKMSNQSQRLFSLFGAAASAIGRRYLRSSPRSRLVIRQAALCTGGGLAAATLWASVASAASTEFMAEPISGQNILKSNDMKARMEGLIMQVQADFCRALEKEEEENALDEQPQKFKVRILFCPPSLYLIPLSCNRWTDGLVKKVEEASPAFFRMEKFLKRPELTCL
jgi:hypothetical protein